MNGLKNGLSLTLVAISVTVFTVGGLVERRYAAVMALASMAGGYAGAPAKGSVSCDRGCWLFNERYLFPGVVRLTGDSCNGAPPAYASAFPSARRMVENYFESPGVLQTAPGLLSDDPPCRITRPEPVPVVW
jgi:hypothetical protein